MSNIQPQKTLIVLTHDDSSFLKHLRAISIFIVIFGHVGGFWFFSPYSQYLLVFNSVFFFVGGAVAPTVFSKCKSTKQYLVQRVVTLFVPYLLLCIIAMFVFFYQNHRLPVFSVASLTGWLTICPTHKYTPFPLGQLWFLQTFIIVSLVSPFFIILQKKKILLCSYLALVILISIPVFLDKAFLHSFVFTKRIYIPFFYSYLYVLGILYGTNSAPFKNPHWIIIGIVLAFFSFYLTRLLNYTPFYTVHVFPPDLYFLAGSTATVIIFTATQQICLFLFNKVKFLTYFSDFFFRHTFSIYLTHTLAIYLVESIIFSFAPLHKNLTYGVIKLFFVLITTASISIPFTWITSFIINLIRSKNRGSILSVNN